IGFVNAGLLTLFQAVGVIFGSNIGTTVTSWLVALVGFKVLAMPAVAVGMLLRVFATGTRASALGEALAGFGVFFLGIDILKETFAGMQERLSLEQFAGDGLGALVLLVGAGFALTVLMQSSSAALAVTLTAAAGGFLPLSAAAAVVIGANVGTTSTAAFAVIGATANAKRAATAHVLFNVVTALAALLALQPLLALVGILAGVAGLQGPATSLAIFHTLTKVFGLLLILPVTPKLVAFLEGRFRAAEENEARPHYLDHNITATPALAVDALILELKRIGAFAREGAFAVIANAPVTPRSWEERKRVIHQLVEAVAAFSRQVRQTELPKDLAEAFPQALRITQYYTDMVEKAEEIALLRLSLQPLADDRLKTEMERFFRNASALLAATDPEAADYSADACEPLLEALQAEYQELKAELLRAGSAGRLPVRQMVWRLDEIGAVRRVLDQAVKAARYLEALNRLVHQHARDGG
ncbi:MAG: Na/Pi cotransporter family protein, partial [Desulfuromonadales bacterium]|nr:Na/Pi cotransporter family protein [Desulfuromonadales bacterium]